MVLVMVDRDAGAAYLRLSTNSVTRTVEFSEDIYVDLDAMGAVVGVELLDLMAPMPIDALAAQHHIHSDAIRILAAASRDRPPRVQHPQRPPGRATCPSGRSPIKG